MKGYTKLTKKELIDEVKFFEELTLKMDMFLYVLGLKDIFNDMVNNETYDEDDIGIGKPNMNDIKKVFNDFLDKYDNGDCADNK
jgi:hypothetical protein